MKDLTQFLSPGEKEEYACLSYDCGNHEKGMICRDCLAIFFIRVMRSARKELEAEIKRYRELTRPRLIHRKTHAC